MMLDQDHFELIRKVEQLYGVHSEKVNEFQRQHQDPVLNLVLECVHGERYFLKEIQAHSFRPELEEIYSQLSKLTPENYRFVLPLRTISGGYIFNSDGIPFVLMRFEEMNPFSCVSVRCEEVLAILSDFHERVKAFPLPRQAHRTFEGWLQRGPEQIRRRFGDSLPFVGVLDDFLRNRFHGFRFNEGVIHWDIHRYNLGVDPGRKILLLDFDLLQPGPLAFDLMKVAPMFRDLSADKILIPGEALNLTFSAVKKTLSQGPDSVFDMRDFRCLIGRCLMMEVWDWPGVDARLTEVREFLQKIENWVVSG